MSTSVYAHVDLPLTVGSVTQPVAPPVQPTPLDQKPRITNRWNMSSNYIHIYFAKLIALGVHLRKTDIAQFVFVPANSDLNRVKLLVWRNSDVAHEIPRAQSRAEWFTEAHALRPINPKYLWACLLWGIAVTSNWFVCLCIWLWHKSRVRSLNVGRRCLLNVIGAGQQWDEKK